MSSSSRATAPSQLSEHSQAQAQALYETVALPTGRLVSCIDETYMSSVYAAAWFPGAAASSSAAAAAAAAAPAPAPAPSPAPGLAPPPPSTSAAAPLVPTGRPQPLAMEVADEGAQPEAMEVVAAAPLAKAGTTPWRLYRVIPGHDGWVRALSVDPTNRYFATGSADASVKIFDLADGGLELSLTNHVAGVNVVQFDERHPYLFSAGDDKIIKCWDLEHNQVVRTYFGHKNAVHAFALHPELDLVLSGGRDKVVRVWDMRSRAVIAKLEGHTDSVFSLLASGAEPQIISGSADATIRLWDLRKLTTAAVLTHHSRSVRAMVHAPNEYAFAAAAAKSIKKFACPHGDLISSMTADDGGIIRTMAINDDNLLVSAGDGGIISFWDYGSGSRFQTLQPPLQPGSLESEACINALTFDRSGTRLISADADKNIKMYKPQ